MTDAELREKYPDVPWLLPVMIQVEGKKAFACRLCIGEYGFAARDFDKLYQTEAEAQQHIAQFH
jgi:hypothetical protein